MFDDVLEEDQTDDALLAKLMIFVTDSDGDFLLSSDELLNILGYLGIDPAEADIPEEVLDQLETHGQVDYTAVDAWFDTYEADWEQYLTGGWDCDGDCDWDCDWDCGCDGDWDCDWDWDEEDGDDEEDDGEDGEDEEEEEE